jgi:hypothetical protein
MTSIIASTVNQGLADGAMGIFILAYLVVWASGLILGFVINRKLRSMVRQGIQGLPYTNWMDSSPRVGFKKWAYFLKGKYRSAGDQRFILLCEIYRILIYLIGLMMICFGAFLFTRQIH